MKAGLVELTESNLRTQMVWLRRLAVSLVGSGPQADDAVQDTLLAALEHRPALDRDVRPWLARVLANFIRKGHRSASRRRNRETFVGEEIDNPPGADELLVRHEAARVVAGLVSALGDPHRELVLLRYAEGLTGAQIALLRGVPEGTVRRQLKEALDQLRGAAAAHYERESRDWRLALIPLATQRQEAPPGTSTGGIFMTIKSRVLLGFGTVVLAGGLVLVARGYTASTEHGRQVAATSSGASVRTSAGAPVPPSRASQAPTTARGAGPPSFTMAAAADPPGCGEKLARLRAVADEHTVVSSEFFEHAKPSPKTQAEVAVIIERIVGRLAGKAGHQVDCRAGLCRVGVLTELGPTGAAPAWLSALDDDIAKRFPPGRTSAGKSQTTKDALTGATLHQHWLYFMVPRAPDEEHPFEGRGNAGTCGERVAALEKAIDEGRERSRRWKEEERQRQHRMETLPINQELTRRVAAALRPFARDATGAPVGVWECRGAWDCRWRGPARVLKSLMAAATPPAVHKALVNQGITDAKPRVVVYLSKEEGKDGVEEGDRELILVLEGKKPASPAPAAPK